MYPANQSGKALAPRHALGGLQAGVTGALLMLACMAVGSLWNERSVWVGPNLFATTFYGPGVYFNEYAGTAWAGVAFFVVLYGLLGALWGCIWREERKAFLGVYGALVGLVVYFILFDFVWQHLNGLVVLYAPNTQLQIGHALWGMMLARSPQYSRRIAERMQDPPPAPAESEFTGAQLTPPALAVPQPAAPAMSAPVDAPPVQDAAEQAPAGSNLAPPECGPAEQSAVENGAS